MEQVVKERVRQKAEKDIKEQERLSAGQKAIEENASQEKAAREKAAEEEETGSVASDEGATARAVEGAALPRRALN
jgi:hypothetical protein